ncbi:hypothetical protein LFM09_07915 [Lentzea alba]|uniref:hypothetical protein n=1 Tax=Lentzea alba TaxID=2714351 RepID=UPI0039BEF3A8
MTGKAKNPGGNTPNTPNTPNNKPSQTHGSINAGAGVSSATKAAKQAATAGQPGGGGGSGTPAGKGKGKGNNQQQGKKPMPPKPTAPPKPEDIHHSDASRKHIIPGEGGKQGGHLAGTGLSTKTEFPVAWKEPKIMDAALQVTQMGPPTHTDPKAMKDANGNPAWGWNYEGMVDGVLVRTTVLSTGEIRTSFPPDATNPGVIQNPPAPSPAPPGIPVGVAPRYSHPDVNNGNGSWTWEGPKGDRMVRIVQDAQGNVTNTDLGPYVKKK